MKDFVPTFTDEVRITFTLAYGVLVSGARVGRRTLNRAVATAPTVTPALENEIVSTTGWPLVVSSVQPKLTSWLFQPGTAVGDDFVLSACQSESVLPGTSHL